MGPNEPYWRTNTSYSPPPSRFDFRYQPEGLSFGSHEGNHLYGSTSSNSRGSRSWLRGNNLSNNQYSTSDGIGPYFSSPSEISPVRQWTPPTIQEIRVDDFGNSSRRVLGPLSFSPTMEGTSAIQDSAGSTSSRSDSSDCESMSKPYSSSSHRNFSSRRCFMSKPIHPLSFPSQTPPREAADNSSQSDSVDFTDVSEPLDSDSLDVLKCGLCERFLSQRSPWGSRRIVRSGDMPITGILSCCHVYHAECLEQTTPKMRKSDPPCPICLKLEEEGPAEQHRVNSKTGETGPKSCREDGPSRPWGCVQAGDCVEGALHGPSRNTMSLLNRNRIKKNLSMKGVPGKEFPGKLRTTTVSPSRNL